MLKIADKPIKDSIRGRQIVGLKQLLNFNNPAGSVTSSEPGWKVLILDKFGQDVVSPILTVQQLRELGVTLHLMLGSKRDSLPDVCAVYLVSPSDENIALISNDLKSNMYDGYYINMISPMSRPQLEQLATAAVQGNTMSGVQKLTDQYLSFISLEEDLFVLKRFSQGSKLSYGAINDTRATDEQMVDLVESIANGLFSVCVTMGIIPIIRCDKNNAAERVAEKLDAKIRNSLRDARNNLFVQDTYKPGQMNFQRPVLVISDRSVDLATMLHHTWSYQALIHDIFDYDQNRVKMNDKSGKKKDYEMCSVADNLWKNYRGSAFPLVAEAIQEDLESYRKTEEDLKKLKNRMGVTGEEMSDANNHIKDSTSKLQDAIESLPQLLEKKKLIDIHTTIATTLLDIIKQRKLDALFETEEKILNGSPVEGNIGEIMKNCSDPMDALRLCLINYLCSATISEKELGEHTAILVERQIPLDALHFAKRLKSFNNLGKQSEHHYGAGTKTVSMFSKLLNQSSKFVMDGVKNLVPKKHNLPLTQMVDEIVDTRPTVTGAAPISSVEYRYFDPKIMHVGNQDGIRQRQGQLVQDVLVFQIGGGNYVEYQNLVDYAKAKGIGRITYGCTELVTPKQFVTQMSELGAMLK
uniref:Sec1 family domain-containing protein 1 n=1 Tax=Rhabditophanes sp. KR3021 TaxID=114890 RepID=A0AC35TSG9_9BILA